MKISFDDKSYIEVSKSNSASNQLFVTIAAKSAENESKLIVNTVEISEAQLISLIKSAK